MNQNFEKPQEEEDAADAATESSRSAPHFDRKLQLAAFHQQPTGHNIRPAREAAVARQDAHSRLVRTCHRHHLKCLPGLGRVTTCSFAVIMTGWVSSGALLLVLMTGAALCHPVRKALGPRSFPSDHYPPQTLLHQRPRQEFPQQHRVAESRFPAVKTDAGSAGVWNYGIEQPVPIPEIPSNAGNLPDMVDFSETTDVSGGVGDPEVPVTDSVLPVDPEGPGSVPILPPPHTEFQPGELFRLERTFEHGDYESDHETQGAPQPPPFYRPLPVPVDLPQRVSPLPPGFFPPPRPDVPYPFDYYFMMGHYPPGTATHFSSSFERGRNYNQDLHYEKTEQSEPQRPWVNAAGPLQNPEQAATQRRVPNDRLNSASTFDYGRYNQPEELPPRYYNTYNPPQVKLTPRFYQRWGGH